MSLISSFDEVVAKSFSIFQIIEEDSHREYKTIHWSKEREGGREKKRIIIILHCTNDLKKEFKQTICYYYLFTNTLLILSLSLISNYLFEIIHCCIVNFHSKEKSFISSHL